MHLLRKWLLLSKRRPRRLGATRGFTLIELLIAMAMALIITSSLLAFVNNMIETDQKEQVKSRTEQELQSAIDYITAELREAVFIYDQNGLQRIRNAADPAQSGIQDQIPPVASYTSATQTFCRNEVPATCIPLLAFWKRSLRPEVLGGPSGGIPQCPVASNQAPATLCKGDNLGLDGDDIYTYSLVVYYLITSNVAPWKGTARIGRFVLQDGVKDPTNPVPSSPRVTGTDPNTPLDQANYNYLGCPGNYNPNNQAGPPNSGNCFPPDDGFRIFNLGASASDLPGKMNSWSKGSEQLNPDTNPVQVLVDYIDGSNRPVEPNICQQVSPDAVLIVPPGTPANQVPGFYVCVDATQQLARVYLRANALPRLVYNSRNRPNTVSYNSARATYFPSVNTPTVQARGFLNLE